MDGKMILIVGLLVAAAGSFAVVAADTEQPMADAGLDRSVDLGETVYLDGSGSRATTGDIVEFRWYVSSPDGDRKRLSENESPRQTYVPETTGTYWFTVEVTNSQGETAEDRVRVDVEQVDEPDGGSDSPDDSDDGEDDTDGDDGSDTDEDDGDEGEDTMDSADSEPANDTVEDTPNDEQQSNTPTEDNSNQSDRKTGSITISGPDIVAQGTTHTFEASSSTDIEYYRWSINHREGAIGSGTEEAIKFDQPRGTTIIKVEAKSSNNENLIYKKEVTIVEADPETSPEVLEATHEINELSGTLLIGDEKLLFESNNVFDESVPRFYQRNNDETVVFEADIDTDDDLDLEYKWDFGDGTTTLSQTPKVEHQYLFDEKGTHEFEVTVTAEDQYGREQSKSRTAQVLGKSESDSNYNLEAVAKSEEFLTVTFDVTSELGRDNGVYPDRQTSMLEVHFGDGNSLNILPMECEEEKSCQRASTQVTHQYESPGRYTAWLSTGSLTDTGEEIRETVTFDSYTEYHYTERTTAVADHVSEDRPGEDWERVGVDSVEREKVGREEARVRENQRVDAFLSDGWERIGTETETEQRRETQVSSQRPGGDWSIAERSVDSETRRVGYDRVEVSNRGLAPDDGTYVGTTRNYRTTTERERSTSRPSGSGWSRVRSTGQVRDGTDTTWRSSRQGPAGWRIVDSRTVTEYYTETERYCKQRASSWFGQGRCLEWGERTVWKSETSREYKFEYPTYSTEYLWERTVSTPEVYYEYRIPQYETVNLHQWERTYTEEIEYGVYERFEYETTEIYEWEKELEREVDRVSLTPPNTDVIDVVGDVSERVIACGSGDGELEDEGCA